VIEAAGMAASQSGSDGSEGGIEVGLEMEELLKPHQFHRLHDAGIAHHQELHGLVVAELRHLHQRTEPGGVDEVNLAQIDHQRLRRAGEVLGDEGEKLFLRAETRSIAADQ
jgi:hypothetical protein